MPSRLPRSIRSVLACTAVAVLLTGCAPEPDQRVVRPDGWAWAETLLEAPPLPADCPAIESSQVGPVNLGGIETLRAWLPGHVHFVYVQPNEPGKGPVEDNDRPHTGMLSGDVAAMFAERTQGGASIHGQTAWGQRPTQCLSFGRASP